MVDAYINYWKKYVDFKSRSTRSDFWWVVLVNDIISLFTLMFGFVGIFIGMDVDSVNSPHITNMFAFVIGIILIIAYFLYRLATIIPDIMIAIRRIRDTGLSPWWYALKLVAVAGSSTYYSGLMTGGLMPMHDGMTITNGLGSIAGLALFIMYLLPTKETTEKATEEPDVPTETAVNLDTTSDEKSPSELASKEIDATQTDSKSKENAED